MKTQATTWGSDFFASLADPYGFLELFDLSRKSTCQLWLVPGPVWVPGLYLCNKIPLFGKTGNVEGIAGVKRPYDHSRQAPAGYARLLKAVEYVAKHFGEGVDASTLAAQVKLSVSQLQREFSKLFGISPLHYIREVRVGVARHYLEIGDDSMSHIAHTCGF